MLKIVLTGKDKMPIKPLNSRRAFHEPSAFTSFPIIHSRPIPEIVELFKPLASRRMKCPLPALRSNTSQPLASLHQSFFTSALPLDTQVVGLSSNDHFLLDDPGLIV